MVENGNYGISLGIRIKLSLTLWAGPRRPDQPKHTQIFKNVWFWGSNTTSRWLAGDGRHPRRDKRCYPTSSFVRIPKSKLHFKALVTIVKMAHSGGNASAAKLAPLDAYFAINTN